MRYDNRAFFLKGKENEKRFRDLIGQGMRESTPQEDSVQKFDMTMTLKIDFKGMKRKNRAEGLNQNIHWIECKNVQGKLGWLYGNADMFVFEIENYYITVWKDDLQELVKKRVVKEFNEDGTPKYSKELFRLYQRRGRKDIITMVPTVELCAIAASIIPKEIENEQI